MNDRTACNLLRNVTWHAVAPDDTGCWSDREIRQVKQNGRRTVYFLPATATQPALYLKHDHPKSPRDRIKCLWRCKAEKEFQSGRLLAAANVPVVEYLAWGRRGRDSFLMSTAETVEGTAVSLWQQTTISAIHDELIVGLCELFSSMRSGNIVHPDLHDANIAVIKQDGRIAMKLLDVYGVRRVDRITREDTAAMTTWLQPILDSAEPAQLNRLMCGIGLAASDADVPDARRCLYASASNFQRLRWPGRRGRLVRDSSLCTVEKSGASAWTLYRPSTVGDVEAAAAAHHDTIRLGGDDVLKSDVKRHVTRVPNGEGSLVVKQFVRTGICPASVPAKRSWLNTHRLALLGIPVPTARAVQRHSDSSALLILKDVGKHMLQGELMHSESRRYRIKLLEALARLVSKLHLLSVCHADMKISNIIVSDRNDSAPVLVLVDLDRIRFDRKLSAADRRRNLMQLLQSMPPRVSPLERLRFLVRYAHLTGVSREELRRHCRALADANYINSTPENTPDPIN
jgi:RIO-like serine/threonine protein kinase